MAIGAQITDEQLPIPLNQEDGGRSQQDPDTDGADGIKDAVSGDPGGICSDGCKLTKSCQQASPEVRQFLSVPQQPVTTCRNIRQRTSCQCSTGKRIIRVVTATNNNWSCKTFKMH